ncbi:hypothetical protein O4D04_00980, partial [Bifidobacterium longum subsp. longum]|nr:hypothetical protein [Bifidobacterium longum subsp. longum]
HGFVPSFPIAVCFVWRQKIVHRTRAMSLSQALNQFAQNLGRYPMLQTSNISRVNHDNASVCIIHLSAELKTCASKLSEQEPNQERTDQ